MTPAELPDDVRHLVHDCVPTIEALEILLLVARDPGRTWRADEVVRLMSGRVTQPSVASYLGVLSARGILRDTPDGWVYAPAEARARAIEGLILAYHQRPVTLVRTVYEAAQLKSVRSFTDAFRLRDED